MYVLWDSIVGPSSLCYSFFEKRKCFIAADGECKGPGLQDIGPYLDGSHGERMDLCRDPAAEGEMQLVDNLENVSGRIYSLMRGLFHH